MASSPPALPGRALWPPGPRRRPHACGPPPVPTPWPWAASMHRALGLDVLACPRCGGRLRVVATIQDPAIVRRLPRSPPRGTGSRPPPPRPALARPPRCHPVTAPAPRSTRQARSPTACRRRARSLRHSAAPRSLPDFQHIVPAGVEVHWRCFRPSSNVTPRDAPRLAVRRGVAQRPLPLELPMRQSIGRPSRRPPARLQVEAAGQGERDRAALHRDVARRTRRTPQPGES
jgi:hypothetical protein